MSNINDYLKWRGDIPISKAFKLNEIDSMILARFSYLIFERIQMNEKETIEDISKKMRDFKNNDFRYNGDKELIINLGKSERYKNMIVTDFTQTIDKKSEKQFGAITIHTSDKEMYISYIGTDSTIYGWKEDCNMSFMSHVPCQIEGKEYLIKVAKKYLGKKIRVGGHSKGGNVAIYSAITAPKNVQNRIIKVYNYDGPGFKKEIIEEIENKEIIEKIETYIPQDSIIGRLMDHKEKCEVVCSIEKGIYQHDIYSWKVLKDDLIKLDKVTDNSDVINKTVVDWLENTTDEQRKIFVDSVFEIFYSTKANTFGEISENLKVNIPIILKSYNGISEEDKKLIIEMIRKFGKAFIKEKYEKNKISK